MSISSITPSALNAWGITPATLSAGSAPASSTASSSSSAGTISSASGVSSSLLGSLASDIQAMLVQFQNDATSAPAASGATGTTAAAGASGTATADAAQWPTSQTGSATQAGAPHHHHHHGGGGPEQLESVSSTATASSAGTTSTLAQNMATDIEQALQGYASNAASVPATILTA